jgi:hypothetical protein
VREWTDYRRTVPRRLQSNCEYCEAARQRARRGHKPKNWYPCGKPGTETYGKNRTRYKRAEYHRLKQDPQWLQARREYARIYGNAKRGTSRAHRDVYLGKDRQVLRGPFDRFVRETGLTPSELSRLTGLAEAVFARSHKYIMLSVADKVFVALDRPQLTAILYP